MSKPENITKQGSGLSESEGLSFIEMILRYRRILIILAHIAAFTVSLFFSFLLAHQMEIQRRWGIYPFPIMLCLSVPIKLLIFRWFRQFRGWWQYVGISDLREIAKSSIGSAIVLMVLWYVYSSGVINTYELFRGPEIDAEQAEISDSIVQLRFLYLQSGDQATKDKLDDLLRKRANKSGLSDLVGIGRISAVRDKINIATQEFQAIKQNDPDADPSVLISKQEQIDKLNAEHALLKRFQRTIEGVIMIDLFATIMILAGLRMFIRMYNESRAAEDYINLKRFLIVGAGNAGEALLREMRRLRSGYSVVGFIDDDPVKHGTEINGITVLGKVDDLPEICSRHSIDEIGIAMPSATRKQLRHVIQVCQGAKLHFQTVPSITDIASGKLRVSQIREVDINDLLGRDVVELELEQIETFLKDKTILVTGAGGSIGSEMCRQVCQFAPKLLLLVEQAENPLFFIERELLKDYPGVSLKAIVRNIADKERIEQVFEEYRPEVVIHAAAHKHVPLMEGNPGEAVKNNILGTMTIANAADKYGAGNFVMISTDKAVNPTSIMGSSKRIAEMYIQDLNSTSKTHLVTVRFGNVLGSNGSVVPIFKKQIAAGGPVTVTHPDMVRYFMTIPEASQLVLQAATMGQGGEIFVLDMGEPVKIDHLARELITLSGFRPDEDIEIKYTGMRPGEKLFEELSIEGEDMQPTRHPKIGIWKNIPKDRQTLRKEIDNLINLSHTQDYDEIVSLIKRLVPEYIGDKNNGQ